MKKSILSTALILSFLVSLSSCTKEIVEDEPLAATSLKGKTETLEGQLQTARRAAMKFHSFTQAEKAAYELASPYVPNMGYHYVNGALLMDGQFEIEKPEALLYVPNEQGKLKLVGIEYIVPGFLSPEPPEGFLGDSDHWHFNPVVAGGSWTLHVWVVEDNPDGVFAPSSPNVPVADPSLD